MNLFIINLLIIFGINFNDRSQFPNIRYGLKRYCLELFLTVRKIYVSTITSSSKELLNILGIVFFLSERKLIIFDF